MKPKRAISIVTNLESQIKLAHTNKVWINSNHSSRQNLLQTQVLLVQIHMDV